MIDTLMALWNKGLVKKTAQILFTLLLIVISMSLVFVVVGGPLWSFLTHRAHTVRADKDQSITAGTPDTASPAIDVTPENTATAEATSEATATLTIAGTVAIT